MENLECWDLIWHVLFSGFGHLFCYFALSSEQRGSLYWMGVSLDNGELCLFCWFLVFYRFVYRIGIPLDYGELCQFLLIFICFFFIVHCSFNEWIFLLTSVNRFFFATIVFIFFGNRKLLCSNPCVTSQNSANICPMSIIASAWILWKCTLAPFYCQMQISTRDYDAL